MIVMSLFGQAETHANITGKGCIPGAQGLCSRVCFPSSLRRQCEIPIEVGLKDSRIQVQVSAFPRSIGLDHSEQRLIKGLLSGTSNGQ